MTEGQKTTTANSGLAKGGVSCFVETFVLRMNFCGKNPALRQAANRYRRAWKNALKSQKRFSL